MQPQHPMIATALADQRQADLVRQANRSAWRAVLGLTVGRLGRPAVAGGGRPSGQPAPRPPVGAATPMESGAGVDASTGRTW